jgi:PTS system cellobiose-specific IIB component
MKEMVKNSIPVLVIDMIAYGTMNGEKVLDTAIDALK